MSKTRTGGQGGMDAQIQSICEKVISSDLFLNKLMEVIVTQLPAIIENKFKDYEEKVRSLEDRVDNLEQQSRANNLRIFGLPEKEDVGTDADKEQIITLVNEKIKVSLKSSDIEYCFRLHKGKNGLRPLIIKFNTKGVRDAVFRKKSMLKGTRIAVKEDLTTKRYQILTRAGQLFGNNNVWSEGGQVKVKMQDGIHKVRSFYDITELSN